MPLPTGQVMENVNHYISHLNALMDAQGFTHDTGTFYFEPRPKATYQRIIRKGSIHCFVDEQGNVYKAEGYNKPAKYIRFNLADQDGLDKLLEACTEPYGGHLYIVR